MDSLSQIVLGASVGEIVLGRKAGNRAMLLGAIGGTIPDLDVVANLFMNEVNATAFHRGISHSIFFALVSAPIFGYLAYQFYQKGVDQNKNWRAIMSVLGGIALLALFGGLSFFLSKSTPLGGITLGLAGIALCFAYYRNMRKYYDRSPSKHMEAISHKNWSWFFFWTIFTHPLLDCFTTYGTQLFQPFSNYRVVFGTVSVVDPIYTLPFLVLLIVVLFFHRESKKRAWINYSAMGISCLFLAYTVFNKIRVNRIFKDTMAERNIPYDRFTSTPTIFNNFLWSATFETEDAYHFAYYSIFDKEKKASDFNRVEKNHALMAPYDNHRYIKILKWFTKNYWTVRENGPNSFIFIDLRWGMLPKDMAKEVGEFPMVFVIDILEDGKLDIHSEMAEGADMKKALSILLERIKGT